MKRLRVFLWRVWAALRSRQIDRDVNDEIASHLAEAADEYIERGLSRDEARQAALRSFGGLVRARELHREARSFAWLDDFRQDVRYAGRTLLRSPAFTIVATVTLALGIGANTAIFTLLDGVVFKPLPVPAPNELVAFYENGPEGAADADGGTGRYLRFSDPRFERLRQALGPDGSLAAATRSSQFVVRLPGASDARVLQAQLVSGNYFAALGVPAARGRAITLDDERTGAASPVAVVSDAFSKRMLGGPDRAVGRTLVINGVSATVVGVTAPGFGGVWTDADADAWVPLTLQPALHYQNNTSSYGPIDNNAAWAGQDLMAWLNLVARIPAADLPRVAPRLQTANRQGLADLAAAFENPSSRASMLAHTLVVEPFSRGFSGLRARYSDVLFVLAAMVALVLLVTCANIANLLLARAAGRARETGIRLALGATAGRLVRQCLTESLMLTLFGGTAGVLLGTWGSAVLARQVLGAPGQLPAVLSPDVRVLMFAAALSLLTVVAFGLAPAFRTIAAGRMAALGLSQRQAVGRAAMRGMGPLLAGQIGLAVLMVYAAALYGRTLINYLRVDPGFSVDRLATASFSPTVSGYTPGQVPALGRRLVEAARTVPGVVSAAVSTCGLVAGCSSSSGFDVEGAGEGITLNVNWVSPGYFPTVGIPLIRGRDFGEFDTDGHPRVAIVNDSIARRYFSGHDPIGRRLGFAGLDTEIVGIVRDAHTQTLHAPPVPMVYFPVDQKGADVHTTITNLDVRVAGDPGPAASGIREAIRRAEPSLLLGDVAPMSQRLARDLSRERLVAALALSFGGLTLFLAALGLYGVLSYGVAQRTQEIGVRMALGARPSQVVRTVLGQSASFTAAGIAAGLLASAAGARFLSGMLFGVTPLDRITLVGVPLLFAAIMALASYLPARRATRVDPLVALRCE